MVGMIKIAKPHIPNKKSPSKKRQKMNDESRDSNDQQEQKEDKTPRGWFNWNIIMGWYDDMATVLIEYGLMPSIDTNNTLLDKYCKQLKMFNEHIQSKAKTITPDVKEEWTKVTNALTITSDGKNMKNDNIKWVKTIERNLEERGGNKPYLLSLILTLNQAMIFQTFYNDEDRWWKWGKTESLIKDTYVAITSAAPRKTALKTKTYGDGYVSGAWQRSGLINNGFLSRLSDIMRLVCNQNLRPSLGPEKVRTETIEKIIKLQGKMRKSKTANPSESWKLDVKQSMTDDITDDYETVQTAVTPTQRRAAAVRDLTDKAEVAQYIYNNTIRSQGRKTPTREGALLIGLIEAIRNSANEIIPKPSKKKTTLAGMMADCEEEEMDTEEEYKPENEDEPNWTEAQKKWFDYYMDNAYDHDTNEDGNKEDAMQLTPNMMAKYVQENINVYKVQWEDKDAKTKLNVTIRKQAIDDPKTMAFLTPNTIHDKKAHYTFKTDKKFLAFHALYNIESQGKKQFTITSKSKGNKKRFTDNTDIDMKKARRKVQSKKGESIENTGKTKIDMM